MLYIKYFVVSLPRILNHSMKKCFLYILLVIIGLTSCSQFEKLRRSSDIQLKYRRAFEYYNAGDYVRAGLLFDDIVYAYRTTNRADTVAFYQAMSYFRQRNFDLAALYFGRLFRENRHSPFAEESEFLVGYCFYMQSPRPSLDQAFTYSAIDAFQVFLVRHPESQFAEDAQMHMSEMKNKLVDKSYLTARLYYDLGQFRASIIALNNSLDDYPETRHREELMYLLLRSNFLLAENAGLSNPDLYFNIGNSFFRLNNIPYAIIYYKKALLLNSSHKDAQQNLDFVLSITRDRQLDMEDNFMTNFLSGSFYYFSINALFVICLIILTLIVLNIHAQWYFSNLDKTILKFINFVLLFLFLGISGLTFARVSIVNNNNDAVIVENTVYVFSGPSESFTRLFTIHEGTLIRIQREEGNWTQITTSGGFSGWISSEVYKNILD